MSMNIEIVDLVYVLEVETAISDVTSNLEIEISSNDKLEINTGYSTTLVYASDVIGLDSYIGNFIDSYEIDCGTP